MSYDASPSVIDEERRKAEELDRQTEEQLEAEFADEVEEPAEEREAIATEPPLIATTVTRTDTETSFNLESLSAADLANNDWEQRFIVNDILVAGEPCMLAGGTKTLKTSILCDMAVSIATGTDFLGVHSVEEVHKVGFLSGESGKATLKETFNRVCNARLLELADIGPFVLSTRLPRIDNSDHLLMLFEWVDEHSVEVLMMDPTYLMIDGTDASNMMIQGAKLLKLAEGCAQRDVSPLMCHHTKRHTGREVHDVPELSDIAWSGFQEFMRQWMLIARRERYEAGTGSHKLWLNVGGSAGHGGLWGLNIEEGNRKDPDGRRWDVEVSTASNVRTAAAQEAQQRKADEKARSQELNAKECYRRLREALDMGPDTKTALKELSGLNTANFGVAMTSLIKDGLAGKCTITKANNQEYDGYEPLNPWEKTSPGHPDRTTRTELSG